MQNDKISGIYINLAKEAVKKLANEKGFTEEETKIFEEKLLNILAMAMRSISDEKKLRSIIEGES
ncbi:MAG: hypothetical protein ACPLW7_01300 [Minisyncoccia bacterium]|jgi:hypothetical protein